MIPRNTPIGAELVCINTRHWFYARASAIPRGPANPSELDGLTEGRHYRLRAYQQEDDLTAGFAVHVEEILRAEFHEVSLGVTAEVGFAPQRFRVLETLKTREAAKRPAAAPVRVRELELA